MSRRMEAYIPLAQTFAARVVLLHEAVAQRLGLNATDLKAFRLLGDEAMTAGRLADETGLTAAAVTALLDRLEKTGFVRRERDPEDRRKVTVRCLDSGHRRVDALYLGMKKGMGALVDGLTEGEFKALLKYLRGASGVLAAQAKELRAGG